MVLFFYLFASLLIASAVGVVFSRNPIFSVLWLIFAFCNAAGLILLLGAEFLSMMLIIVYVGAVAVLFLFVVMMLDIKLAVIQGELRKNFSLAFFLAILLLGDLVAIILIATKNIKIDISNVAYPIDNSMSNINAIASVLYTDFILPFEICGVILFVAMIACITLTFRKETESNGVTIKRQNVKKQLSHNKDNCLEVVKLACNKGIEDISYE